MDLRSAVIYMKQGYRVRRAGWHPDSYMKLDCLGEIIQFSRHEYWSIGKGELTKHSYVTNDGIRTFEADEVLADDWELITTGIRKEFSKHENGMEYEDDTDWDNYVPPKGGWGYDDEDE